MYTLVTGLCLVVLSLLNNGVGAVEGFPCPPPGAVIDGDLTLGAGWCQLIGVHVKGGIKKTGSGGLDLRHGTVVEGDVNFWNTNAGTYIADPGTAVHGEVRLPSCAYASIAHRASVGGVRCRGGKLGLYGALVGSIGVKCDACTKVRLIAGYLDGQFYGNEISGHVTITNTHGDVTLRSNTLLNSRDISVTDTTGRVVVGGNIGTGPSSDLICARYGSLHTYGNQFTWDRCPA